MKAAVVAVILSCVCGVIVTAPAPAGLHTARIRSRPFILDPPLIDNDDTFSFLTLGEKAFSKHGTYVKPVFPFQRVSEVSDGNYPGDQTPRELEVLYLQGNQFSKEAPLPDLPREDEKHEYKKIMKMMEALLRMLEQPNHQTSDQRRKDSEVDDVEQKIEDENFPHILSV